MPGTLLCPFTHTAVGSSAKHFAEEETTLERPQDAPLVTQLVRRGEGEAERASSRKPQPGTRGWKLTSFPLLAWELGSYPLLLYEDSARAETQTLIARTLKFMPMLAPWILEPSLCTCQC